MPTTSQGLYKPDATTGAPMLPILTNMQDSVDVALRGRAAIYATRFARDAALPTPTVGQTVVTADFGIYWTYFGGQWRMLNVPVFTSVSDRDSAIPTPTVTDRCWVADTEYFCVTNGIWTRWTSPWVTLPISAGIMSPGTARHRLLGGASHFSYQGTGLSITADNAADGFCSIPVGARPIVKVALAATIGGLRNSIGWAQPAGGIGVRNTSGVLANEMTITGTWPAYQ